MKLFFLFILIRLVVSSSNEINEEIVSYQNIERNYTIPDKNQHGHQMRTSSCADGTNCNFVEIPGIVGGKTYLTYSAGASDLNVCASQCEATFKCAGFVYPGCYLKDVLLSVVQGFVIDTSWGYTTADEFKLVLSTTSSTYVRKPGATSAVTTFVNAGNYYSTNTIIGGVKYPSDDSSCAKSCLATSGCVGFIMTEENGVIRCHMYSTINNLYSTTNSNWKLYIPSLCPADQVISTTRIGCKFISLPVGAVSGIFSSASSTSSTECQNLCESSTSCVALYFLQSTCYTYSNVYPESSTSEALYYITTVKDSTWLVTLTSDTTFIYAGNYDTSAGSIGGIKWYPLSPSSCASFCLGTPGCVAFISKGTDCYLHENLAGISTTTDTTIKLYLPTLCSSDQIRGDPSLSDSSLIGCSARVPTATPTRVPTFTPTKVPTVTPTKVPTVTPTKVPTVTPTSVPTATPSRVPTVTPTKVPTVTPTKVPTVTPTKVPTVTPSRVPTATPTTAPTDISTRVPSTTPTRVPSATPSRVPTATLTTPPIDTPSRVPIATPTCAPSYLPTSQPTQLPFTTQNQLPSTFIPTTLPTNTPTRLFSTIPTLFPLIAPNIFPTILPSNIPTQGPHTTPSLLPSKTPNIISSNSPSVIPILVPSQAPGTTFPPSATAFSSTSPVEDSIFKSAVPSKTNMLTLNPTSSSLLLDIVPSESSSTPSTVSIGVIVGVIVAVIALLCIICSYYFLYSRKVPIASTESKLDDVKDSHEVFIEEIPRESIFTSVNPYVKTGSNRSNRMLFKNSFNGDSNITQSVKSPPVIAPTKIKWADLKITTKDPNDAIIGKGSYGLVFRAVLTTHRNADVVIKVMKQTGRLEDDETVKKLAYGECRLIKEAESKIVYKHSIVKAYGIAEGELPTKIAKIMNVHTAIGIVMRYEGGGSLTDKIYPKTMVSADSSLPPVALVPMDITEKIRLIAGLARGLTELHAAGIVHGDIKPDNILLSGDTPSEVRLGDFGLARMWDDGISGSTMVITKHTRGTVLYCAPEMMVNPYDEMIAGNNSLVSKASRKTDMYAFALVSWEILTGSKPFENIKRETTLSMKLHQGERPPISKIPSDCPKTVIAMIECCWDRDRGKRLAAAKCFLRLQYEYRQITNVFADVCISYHKSNQQVCVQFHHKLSQLGIKVCTLCEENRVEENEQALANSQVMIAFLNVAYQEDSKCLSELRAARHAKPPKTVLPIFTQTNHNAWTDQDVDYLCQIRSEKQKIWDISYIVSNTNEQLRHINEGEKDEEVYSDDYDAYIDDLYTHVVEILKNHDDEYIEKFIQANPSPASTPRYSNKLSFSNITESRNSSDTTSNRLQRFSKTIEDVFDPLKRSNGTNANTNTTMNTSTTATNNRNNNRSAENQSTRFSADCPSDISSSFIDVSSSTSNSRSSAQPVFINSIFTDSKDENIVHKVDETRELYELTSSQETENDVNITTVIRPLKPPRERSDKFVVKSSLSPKISSGEKSTSGYHNSFN